MCSSTRKTGRRWYTHLSSLSKSSTRLLISARTCATGPYATATQGTLHRRWLSSLWVWWSVVWTAWRSWVTLGTTMERISLEVTFTTFSRDTTSVSSCNMWASQLGLHFSPLRVKIYVSDDLKKFQAFLRRHHVIFIAFLWYIHNSPNSNFSFLILTQCIHNIIRRYSVQWIRVIMMVCLYFCSEPILGCHSSISHSGEAGARQWGSKEKCCLLQTETRSYWKRLDTKRGWWLNKQPRKYLMLFRSL